METNNDNIFFYVNDSEEEGEDNDTNNKLLTILNELENTEINTSVGYNSNDYTTPQVLNYNMNYTIKELLLICSYYGISKQLKTNKYVKEEIINFLVIFENDPNNEAIVFKRQNMWFYMNELKNDKFMKKYIIW